MTALEAKELFIQNLQAKIESRLTATNLTTRFETCSSAPSQRHLPWIACAPCSGIGQGHEHPHGRGV